MAVFSWIATTGSFITAANWTPVGGPPGAADTANFGSTSGVISGIGAVSVLNFQSGGTWSLSGQVRGGSINDQDSLTILNGGVLTSTSGQFGVGNAVGATGSLAISAGGSVTSTIPAQTLLNEFTVANSTGSTGSVTVSGPGALIDMGANGAGIGNTGTGSLSVTSGGIVRLASSNSALLSAFSSGNVTGSRATTTVSGSGSSITAAGYVYIGRGGTATLTVSGGGTFTGGSAVTSTVPGYGIAIGDGTATLNSSGVPNSTLYYGGSDSAVVTGAGSLLHSLYQIRLGYRGTSGSLLVDASGAVQAGANIIVGGGTDRVGGSGTLTVQNGGTVTAGGTHTIGTAGIVFGNDVGTTGTATVVGSGSTLNTNGDRLTIGGNGTGILTISSGGRAIAGSAGYSDVESAFSVAGAVGASGMVTITGAGSMLTATGDSVIGGNEKGAGPTAGGTGAVSLSSGGALSVSGTLTIEAGGTLTVDAASKLTVPAVTINGGTATMAMLSNSAAFSFGTGGLLAVATVSGANTVGNFTYGDTIDIAGPASVSGNVVTTSSGSIALSAAPANTSYQLFDDGHGGENVALTPQTVGVYRFFDNILGTHLYTSSLAEEQTILATRPDLTLEGIGLQAVAVAASDPSAVAVYRFFDTTNGTHFFTASASERDTVIATRSDLSYEPTSSFYEHATAQPGDVAVYRFFSMSDGTHFYTDSASERANILATRTDMVLEGIGFYEPHQNYASS